MLRIATWNIFWGLGYPSTPRRHALRALRYVWQRCDRHNTPHLAQQLASWNPDLIGLQEVDIGSVRNGHYSHIKEVSRRTGLKQTLFAADRTWLGYCNDGNATLSRATIRESEIIELPYRIERRNALRCTIMYKRQRIDIYTTHWGAHKANRQERIEQAKALHERIRMSQRPAIVMGDLNCEPNDEEFRVLCGEVLTQPKHSVPTYPAYAPTQRFDHILHTRHFKTKEYRTINAKHADHLPVFAVLERT